MQNDTEVLETSQTSGGDFYADEPETTNFFDDLDEPEPNGAGGEKDFDADTDFDEADLPPFDFAEPQTVELKDGTACRFRIPDLEAEKRADRLRVTTRIVAPNKINGKQPFKEETAHVKADVRYFLDNAVELSGFVWDGKEKTVNAKDIYRPAPEGAKASEAITYAKAVPIRHKRSFVNRLYGGRLEVENPETEGEQKGVRIGSGEITVKHTIGIEEKPDGTLTKPKHVVRYVFREPTDYEFSLWDKVADGYSIPLNKGGMRSTTTLVTENVVKMCDRLLVRVEGGTFKGKPFDVSKHELPAAVRRNAVVIAFGYWMRDVGNE